MRDSKGYTDELENPTHDGNDSISKIYLKNALAIKWDWECGGISGRISVPIEWSRTNNEVQNL